MNELIVNYFDLKRKTDSSNYFMNAYKEGEFEELLKSEVDKNQKLNEDFKKLKSELLTDNDKADEIRLRFIRIINEVISILDKIEKLKLFPSLDQGMIIQHYLYSTIISDFKTCLISSTGYAPNPTVYASKFEWNFSPMKSLFESYRDELVGSNFDTMMDAINYFHYIEQSFWGVFNELYEKRILMP